MTFTDFEKLTPQEQLDVLENADPMECPFWMERLKMSVYNMAPQCLIALPLKQFDKLNSIYKNLITLKN